MSQRGSLSLSPPFRILQREKRSLSSLDPRSFHLSICALCTRQPRPILIVPLGRGTWNWEMSRGQDQSLFFSCIRTEAFSLSHFLKRWKRRKSICGSIRANNWLHLNERKSFACLYTNKRIRRRRSVVVRADFRRPLAPYFHAPNLLYVVYNNGSVCVLTSIFFPVLCCLELCIYSRKKKRKDRWTSLFFADDK